MGDPSVSRKPRLYASPASAFLTCLLRAEASAQTAVLALMVLAGTLRELLL